MSTSAAPLLARHARATPSSRWVARSTGRRLLGLGIAASVVVVLALLSLGLGAKDVDVASVVRAFAVPDGSSAQLIVTELRLPRTLIAILVGLSLGLAGTLMQGVTHNPLGDPGFLGVNQGASLAVALGIMAGVAETGGYVWFALVGAAVAVVVVALLGAVGRGRPSPVRLALAGAVVAAICASITSAILVVDESTLDRFRFWDVGSLAGGRFEDLFAVLPFALVGVVLALALGRSLNALALGDDMAAALGQRTARTRGIAAVSIVLLAGASVAVAGPIAFVGLAVPHAARLVVGSDYRWILACSLVLGPALMLWADISGRLLVRPAELEVGIVTALIGAPVLVWLVRRRGGLEPT